jgi:hypothetical protein
LRKAALLLLFCSAVATAEPRVVAARGSWDAIQQGATGEAASRSILPAR